MQLLLKMGLDPILNLPREFLSKHITVVSFCASYNIGQSASPASSMVFVHVKAPINCYGLDGKASQKLNIDASDMRHSQ